MIEVLFQQKALLEDGKKLGKEFEDNCYINQKEICKVGGIPYINILNGLTNRLNSIYEKSLDLDSSTGNSIAFTTQLLEKHMDEPKIKFYEFQKNLYNEIFQILCFFKLEH